MKFPLWLSASDGNFYLLFLSMKKMLLLAGLLLASVFLVWCSDADIASHNISRDSDYFRVFRRVVFYNGITNEYMLSIEGFCSLQGMPQSGEIAVVCKDGSGYKKHFLGLSDNVTYIVEQLDASNVSADHYKVIFKPSAILPQIEVQ